MYWIMDVILTQMSVVVHVSVINGSSGGICVGGCGVILEPSASVASDCWLPYGLEKNII